MRNLAFHSGGVISWHLTYASGTILLNVKAPKLSDSKRGMEYRIALRVVTVTVIGAETVLDGRTNSVWPSLTS